MKYVFLCLFFLVLYVSTFAQVIPLQPPPGATMRVRWNEDAPYSMRNSDGTITGIYVDVIRETLRRMGYDMVLIKMPFARGLVSLETGALDVLPGTFVKQDRRRYALFAEPGFSSKNVLFISKTALEKWNFQNLADLKRTGFRLGVQTGVSYGNEFDELSKDKDFVSHLVVVGERIQLWRMAVLNRIDGLIADELTGRFEIAKLGIGEQIVQSPVVVSFVNEEPVATAFSKKTVNTEFLDLFNETQRKMNLDGTTQAILKKYR